MAPPPMDPMMALMNLLQKAGTIDFEKLQKDLTDSKTKIDAIYAIVFKMAERDGIIKPPPGK